MLSLSLARDKDRRITVARRVLSAAHEITETSRDLFDKGAENRGGGVFNRVRKRGLQVRHYAPFTHSFSGACSVYGGRTNSQSVCQRPVFLVIHS